jgi:FkbM family methyltransferase
VSDARDELREFHRRYGWLFRLRPQIVAAAAARVLLPAERRRIVGTDMGVRLYVDPVSHLGRVLALEDGRYEPDTGAVLKEHLGPGSVFLDVGANEGIFSAVGGRLVGAEGLVLAVEPQRRLHDVIAINLALNGITWGRIVPHALGPEQGARGRLHLHTALNTGASSIVSRYRFARASQEISYVAPANLLAEHDIATVDLCKVDVEGFEPEVVQALLPLVAKGRVRALLVDYHAAILRVRGIDPGASHRGLLDAGLRVASAEPAALAGPVLYER